MSIFVEVWVFDGVLLGLCVFEEYFYEIYGYYAGKTPGEIINYRHFTYYITKKITIGNGYHVSLLSRKNITNKHQNKK